MKYETRFDIGDEIVVVDDGRLARRKVDFIEVWQQDDVVTVRYSHWDENREDHLTYDERRCYATPEEAAQRLVKEMKPRSEVVR